MTITEIRDALTQAIDAGYGKERLWDDENPDYFIDGLIEKNYVDEDDNECKRFYFDMDQR